jgi:hypothetical protein
MPVSTMVSTPLHGNARQLPFATEFFDSMLSIDSFAYYGTDDLYLNYLLRFLKPGGSLGIAGAGLTQEIAGSPPEHLARWWTPDLWCLHSASWWRRHWERTDLLAINVADTLPDGWSYGLTGIGPSRLAMKQRSVLLRRTAANT